MAGQPRPASSAELEALCRKGGWYIAMIRSDSGNALQLMRQEPKLKHLNDSQSRWKDPKDLEKNGWISAAYAPMWTRYGVNDALQHLGIPATESDQDIRIVHQPTKSQYNNVFKVREGLIMPFWVWSPVEEAKRRGIKLAPIALANLSDLLFLEYKKRAEMARPKASVENLRYLLFHNVENMPTWAAILTIFDAMGMMRRPAKGKPIIELPNWPGVELSSTFEPDPRSTESASKNPKSKDSRPKKSKTDTRPFLQAVLGTPIGATVAWMLIQHKAEFENKEVIKINIFRNRSITNLDNAYPHPTVLFTIGDRVPAATRLSDADDRRLDRFYSQ